MLILIGLLTWSCGIRYVNCNLLEHTTHRIKHASIIYLTTDIKFNVYCNTSLFYRNMNNATKKSIYTRWHQIQVALVIKCCQLLACWFLIFSAKIYYITSLLSSGTVANTSSLILLGLSLLVCAFSRINSMALAVSTRLSLASWLWSCVT